jgi:hypothetical protein
MNAPDTANASNIKGQTISRISNNTEKEMPWMKNFTEFFHHLTLSSFSINHTPLFVTLTYTFYLKSNEHKAFLIVHLNACGS